MSLHYVWYCKKIHLSESLFPMLTLKGKPIPYAVNTTTFVKRQFSLANGNAPTSRRPVIVVLFSVQQFRIFSTACVSCYMLYNSQRPA